MMMQHVNGFRVALAYKVARHLIERRQAQRAQPQTSVDRDGVTADWHLYADWRYNALRDQFVEYFGVDSVKDKIALDFGCGDGALCSVLLDAGAAKAHGVDLDEKSLARFSDRLQSYGGEKRPTFSRSTTADRIDEADASYDVIFCMDVLEHVMEYRAIMREWHRVLRPGGSVNIWWQPYWHPFGHHVYDWVPIPWAHAFLDDDELNEVCARIVDWAGFDAPIWDRNPDGTRRNRFRVATGTTGFLNKLTIREFERQCADARLTIARREFVPFAGRARRASALLTHVPVARDFFMACAVYRLVRED
jgi:2-polyprenyl-3-methyl-5-hydroxy-6-metoxy-1,4-benzoquinol methylase